MIMQSIPLITVLSPSSPSKKLVPCALPVNWMKSQTICKLALFGCIASTSCANAQSHWEMTAYNIVVDLAIDPTIEHDTRLASDLPAAVIERCDNYIGAAWQLSVETTKGDLRQKILASLDAVRAEDFSKLPEGTDKVIAMALVASPDGYRAQAREYDVRTQTWGAIAERAVSQESLVADAVFETLWQAFAPIAQIDVDAERHVMLRPRAAGLLLRDPSLQFIQAGDLFRPVVRKLDRKGKTTTT
jgi:hypothetical protein